MHRKSVRRRRCLLEGLETRVFLSLSAAGAEFKINTFTTNAQDNPIIAMDGDGDFVAVWESFAQDASSDGIYAQRFNSLGVAQGSEFRVNTYTTGSQNSIGVAMDGDGDFVVVWDSNGGQDGNVNGIFGQRFNALGAAQGNEFRVNTYTTNAQYLPTVAMDAAGDFVVAWTSQGQESVGNVGIYAQRYNFNGVAQGNEFLVNSYTTELQQRPAAAMDADGDFVIAWESYDQEAPGSAYGIYARRFNSAGSAQGTEFKVNTFTTNYQLNPTVAMDYAGDFVIAWESIGQDPGYGIYAKRFNSVGAVQGSEFLVNTYTTGNQREAAAAMDADGDFVITWSDTSQAGAFAKVYDKLGNELTRPSGSIAGTGNEFRVNTYTTGVKTAPTAAIDAKGDFVIGWYGAGTGDAIGVFAQQYTESVDTAAPVVAGVTVNGQQLRAYQVYAPPLSRIIVSFSEDVTTAGGNVGANSVTNPANWQITVDGVDVTAGLTVSSYGFNAATNRYEAELTIAPSIGGGNIQVKARDNIRDIAGVQLDGNFDGAALGTFVLPFSMKNHAPLGTEFRVNTYTTGTQNRPAVASDRAGNYVVVWADGTGNTSGQDGNLSGIYAQRYTAEGIAVGPEFRVNSYTTMSQTAPAVAMDADGDFVVVWQSDFEEATGGYGIYGSRFNAAGVPQSTFHVNTYTTNAQTEPVVAMDAAGNFVVAWQSILQDASGDGVYAKRFNAAGVVQGGEFKVNTYTTGSQSLATVGMDASGNFVVAWEDNGQDGSSTGVYAQRYNSTGVAQGSEFRANTTTANSQSAPVIGVGETGVFVITWQDDVLDGSGSGIFAQGYSSAGAAQGNEFKVNTYTTNSQSQQSVVMRSNGEFVVVWSSSLQDGDLGGIYAQEFTAGGTASGDEFKVNTYTTNTQVEPAIAADALGNFVVAWSSFLQDGGGTGVYAQRYQARRTPTVTTLVDAPDPAFTGVTLTLTASGVSDADGSVTGVSFYRETNGVAGLQVGAEGDTLVGTDLTEAAGTWSIALSTGAMIAGTYTYYAQATDNDALIGAPASTTNTVAAHLGPIVLNAEFLYDTSPQALRFTFDRDVSTTFDLTDITVQKIGGGAVPALSAPVFAGNVATLTFASLLADGNYRATINAAGVTDGGNPMPANYIFDFFIIGGDANHDRKVDVYDLLILANNWLGTGKTYSQADFDYNGVVNATDLGILGLHWQQTLAAPAAPLAALPTSARAPARTAVRAPTRVIDLVQ